jgi:hypothetical protein
MESEAPFHKYRQGLIQNSTHWQYLEVTCSFLFYHNAQDLDIGQKCSAWDGQWRLHSRNTWPASQCPTELAVPLNNSFQWECSQEISKSERLTEETPSRVWYCTETWQQFYRLQMLNTNRNSPIWLIFCNVPDTQKIKCCYYYYLHFTLLFSK